MQTLAQKLIARACGRPQVAPGEIVSCQVDLVQAGGLLNQLRRKLQQHSYPRTAP